MINDDKMQPSALSLFLGLAIHLGQYLVIETTPQYPCNLWIVKGEVSNHHGIDCDGFFPCDVYIHGEILYSLTCSYSREPGDHKGPLYICEGTCPYQTDYFTSGCRDGEGWFVDIEHYCWSKDKHPSTTTHSPPHRNDENDDSSSTSTSVLWVAIMSVMLVIVMICICGVAMRTARQRRQRELQMYRNRAGSPTMIYSVTLDCGPGQALGQSINDYMRRTSQQRGIDLDLDRDLDRDIDRDPDTLIRPTVVVKPPSYDEVIRADNNEGNKDIPNPNPPPYSVK